MTAYRIRPKTTMAVVNRISIVVTGIMSQPIPVVTTTAQNRLVRYLHEQGNRQTEEQRKRRTGEQTKRHTRETAG